VRSISGTSQDVGDSSKIGWRMTLWTVGVSFLSRLTGSPHVTPSSLLIE
jgi:hypothetical protein